YCCARRSASRLFYFPPTPTPAISTLSLHDALPICRARLPLDRRRDRRRHRRRELREPPDGRAGRTDRHPRDRRDRADDRVRQLRSEEHTSELQSRFDLVCRLLLEKKKKQANTPYQP